MLGLEVTRAVELFAAGDIVAARRKWAEVRKLLSRRLPGKRGKPRHVTHAGRTQTVAAWARELGWTPQALGYRLDVMPFEVALVPNPRKKP